jgi:hypothetical protein
MRRTAGTRLAQITRGSGRAGSAFCIDPVTEQKNAAPVRALAIFQHADGDGKRRLPTPRGAASLDDAQAQRVKLVAAIFSNIELTWRSKKRWRRKAELWLSVAS